MKKEHLTLLIIICLLSFLSSWACYFIWIRSENLSNKKKKKNYKCSSFSKSQTFAEDKLNLHSSNSVVFSKEWQRHCGKRKRNMLVTSIFSCFSHKVFTFLWGVNTLDCFVRVNKPEFPCFHATNKYNHDCNGGKVHARKKCPFFTFHNLSKTRLSKRL